MQGLGVTTWRNGWSVTRLATRTWAQKGRIGLGEDKIKDDGRSMKSLEHAMEIMSADSACSNEASRAFIQLGGIRQFIYTFQDGAQFLDILVERC